MKKCSKCKLEKPLSDFHNAKNGRLGKHHYCKNCMSAQRKQTYNYSKSFNRRIRAKYNLSSEELISMHNSQNKKCKICGNIYEDISKHGGLYIDHCHTTGKVRGLLCAKCNQLLGACRDNVVILQSAVDYLNSQ